MNTNKRILGIDLGIKRIGLALSDKFGISIRALNNLYPRSRQEDILYIVQLCSNLHVKYVIIGYPLLYRHGFEVENLISKRAVAFSDCLFREFNKNHLKIIVYLINESYTSKIAVKRLAKLNISKKKRKLLIDGEVACILIEIFLETIVF
jgi:putative Holliday junction resolvase